MLRWILSLGIWKNFYRANQNFAQQVTIPNNMKIIDIHKKAFGFYKKYYQTKNRTFYLRKKYDNKKRLISGYIFQGDDNNYVFTSPFRPADNNNQTQRIGFVINLDKSCYIEIALNDKGQDITNNLDFYLALLDYFEVEHNENIIGSRFYKNIEFKTNQNWSIELENFLHKTVDDIVKIAKKHNVSNDYLFFSEDEFEKRLKVIENIQIVRNQMFLYDNNKTDFPINSNVVWYFNIKDKQGYKEYPVKALLESVKKNLNLEYYSTNTAKKVLKDIFKESNMVFIDKNTKSASDISVENNDMSKIQKNQILYGPPGTGKTYSTVEKALEILGETDRKDIKSIGKLKEEFGSQVEFVTFHQSFSYEDFVEGLKANSDSGELLYEVENGVFKQICENAKDIAVENNVSYDFDESSGNIWKISLGDTKNSNDDFIYPYCIENNKILLGFGESINFNGLNNRKSIADKLNNDKKYSYPPTAINTLKNKIKINDIVIVSHGNTKIKAIGRITGDYQYLDENDDLESYVQARNVEWLLVAQESFSYEKLLYKKLSQKSIYDIKKNVKIDELKKILSNNEEVEIKPYILIIDEINRGNISRIFGELITLIEPSKRAGENEAITLKLPYSKEDFSVPNNLYVIGTMNTADRSLTMMDTALRRRFDFVEMPPKESLIKNNIDGLDLQKMLKIINQRIEILYDREHTIGHAFLMNIDTLGQLQNTFTNKILPLLEEYFYDDFEKIKAVLSDKGDNFYEQVKYDDDLFASDFEYNNEQKIYKRNNKELELKDFINIYASQQED
jgi:5-methylcytosine-specific restriction protein B